MASNVAKFSGVQPAKPCDNVMQCEATASNNANADAKAGADIEARVLRPSTDSDTQTIMPDYVTAENQNKMPDADDETNSMARASRVCACNCAVHVCSTYAFFECL